MPFLDQILVKELGEFMRQEQTALQKIKSPASYRMFKKPERLWGAHEKSLVPSSG